MIKKVEMTIKGGLSIEGGGSNLLHPMNFLWSLLDKSHRVLTCAMLSQEY